MHSRFFEVAVLVAALLQMGRSFAAGQDEAPPMDEAQRTAQARALFDEGIELSDREQYEDAADRFRRAYALRASASVAFNMAATLARAGKPAEALTWIDRVLQDPAVRPRIRTMAEHLRAEVEPKIGRITVTMEGDGEEVRVMLDDQPFERSALGVAQNVEPGAHVVTAVRNRSTVATEHVNVAEGASVDVNLHIPLPPPTLPREEEWEAPPDVELVSRAPENRESTPITKQVWFWGAVGAVAAGTLITIVVLTAKGAEESVEGNANPGVLVWR